MEKRTKQLLIGGAIIILVLAILFSFMKNRTDWRTEDHPGSGTNWIGKGDGSNLFD